MHRGGPELRQGADRKIRDQERTLAERMISELSGTGRPDRIYQDDGESAEIFVRPGLAASP
jgi:hypothetical protein